MSRLVILSVYSRKPLSVMSETQRMAKWVRPLPWGEGGPRPALSPAGAGRVRGQLQAEDGSERLGASCSIDTSKASSFWRGPRSLGPKNPCSWFGRPVRQLTDESSLRTAEILRRPKERGSSG